jgi:nucleoid-associated protein YgaU
MSEAMRAAVSLYNDPRFFSEAEVRIRNNKLRRQRIFRRQVFLLGLASALFIFVSILFASSIMADAQSDEFTPSFKYYKTVTIHANDTLWDIAGQYYSDDDYASIREYMAEICQVNAISDASELKAGESLIIPYYSTEFK